jgi:hypothetical protein
MFLALLSVLLSVTGFRERTDMGAPEFERWSGFIR